MAAKAPSLQEILQLTRSELTKKQEDDSIHECGRAAFTLLTRDPDLSLQLAYQHLHDVPYREVKTCWRRLYVDAALWQAIRVLEQREKKHGKAAADDEKRDDADVGERDGDWITRVVKILDMALILTGAPEREDIVELWFSALEGVLGAESHGSTQTHDRPAKRRKLDSDASRSSFRSSIPLNFPATLSSSSPMLRHPIPRATNPPSLSAFQTKVSNLDTQTPLIIEGALEHWPALDERPWNNPQYLLDRTLGGRRLVPVEVGRSYTDAGWGQKILAFGKFLEDFMLQEQEDEDEDEEDSKRSYLAQHDLFAQIPVLRSDISIPDYCYTAPAHAPSLHSATNTVPTLEEPLLNAWFGPASTISPLHTDPYHNILAQVVGYKYIRLYPPSESSRLYPRGVEEGGVDMSNTSAVDLDVGMRVWGEISCWGKRDSVEIGNGVGKIYGYEERFPNFKEAKYMEGILGPGESLYIPVGWWHYVRSLTPSFSVSFWFN